MAERLQEPVGGRPTTPVVWRIGPVVALPTSAILSPGPRTASRPDPPS